MLLVFGLGATLSACQTLSKDEQDAYARRPQIEISGIGDYRRVDIKTRPWVIQGFQLWVPEKAKAIAVYFSGFDGRGSALELENLLPAKSIGFVNVSPPSDLKKGFRDGAPRSNPSHITDIEAVIGYIRSEYALPVWLVGMSMGSVSAAHLATSGSINPDGVVFMSAVTASMRTGRNSFDETLVTQYPLHTIKVPVLVIAHANDGCNLTPPSGGEAIVAAATGSSKSKIIVLNGGLNVSNDPCTGTSFHTFGGMRAELASVIADYIVSNLPGNR